VNLGSEITFAATSSKDLSAMKLTQTQIMAIN
jgi:hypothetical protein